MLRVVLADDQIMIRSGLRALLAAEPDLQVVAEAGDKQQSPPPVPTAPDVIVMDIRMPGWTGWKPPGRYLRTRSCPRCAWSS